MAIALTPFQAICGFRELQEIWKLVLDLSLEPFALEDISAVQESVDNPSTATFKPFFESIMKADAECVKVLIDNLLRGCARGLSLNKLDGEEKTEVELASALSSDGWGGMRATCLRHRRCRTRVILRYLTSIRSCTDCWLIVVTAC